MNGFGTRNELHCAAQEAAQRELAERANRADAIVAGISIFMLAILLIVQLAEKAAS